MKKIRRRVQTATSVAGQTELQSGHHEKRTVRQSVVAAAPFAISPYLGRIGYKGPQTPSHSVLRELHSRHLYTVLFENLDIHLGRPIECDASLFYEKIVVRGRGGFCYELNGLFAELLSALGFEVSLLSGRVPSPGGELGPDFDHMALLVTADGERMLADVGFGDCFLHPLRIDSREPQSDPAGVFRLERQDDSWSLLRDDKLEYVFSLTPRELSEFAPMCHYQQTSPDSPFTKKRVCSRATADGRITVMHDRIIDTRNGVRTELPLGDDAEWRAALRTHFGFELN